MILVEIRPSRFGLDGKVCRGEGDVLDAEQHRFPLEHGLPIDVDVEAPLLPAPTAELVEQLSLHWALR